MRNRAERAGVCATMSSVMRVGILVVGLALAGCTAPAPGATLELVALAGPVCPVVSDPPDPACADRPVADAVMVVRDVSGSEIARITTDGDGRAGIEVAAGSYLIVPQPVAGLMGTAQPVAVVMAAGPNPSPVTLVYDTGIR